MIFRRIFYIVPIILLSFCWACSNPMPPRKTELIIDFVPYSIICQHQLDPYIILPLLKESPEHIQAIDSNSTVEVLQLDMDKDPEKEMILLLKDEYHLIHNYYFFNYTNDQLNYTAKLYNSPVSSPFFPYPIIDSVNRMIWIHEYIHGSEIQGYCTYGLKYTNDSLHRAVTLTGQTFETFYNPDPALPGYNGQVHLEKITVSDTLITLHILSNINHDLTRESNFSENIYSRRFKYDLLFDTTLNKYVCTEKVKDVTLPPILPSDILEYEEVKNGRKIVK